MSMDIEDPKPEEKILSEQDGNLKNGSENKAEEETQKLFEKLELRLQEVANAYLKNLTEWWNERAWNNYLYKSREMNVLDLPTVNAFLSEWEDDGSYDESKIFEKCHECLKIIDELNFTIAACKNATEKQKDLWKEGIKNIQETMDRKLKYTSFMLLKDADLHMNPKTENMEYGIKDCDKDGNNNITLCLWANLYTAVRRQGMSILDYSFILPMDIVEENCGVRLMHTLYDHVSPEEKILDETILKEKDVEEVKISLSEIVTEDEPKSEESIEEKTEVKKGEEKAEENKEVSPNDDDEKNTIKEKNMISTQKDENQPSENEPDEEIREEVTEKESSEFEKSINFAAFHPKMLPPLLWPDMKILNPDKYFVVGGIYFFELLVLPDRNAFKEGIIYIHREFPKLRHIQYRRKIVPSRSLDGDTPYIVSVYERMRFEKEVKSTMFVQLQLPKKVLYLEKPIPARLFPEKGGYSNDCIYAVKYTRRTRRISFKTSHFGIFGMLQNKYANFPYKKWSLKGGDVTTLSLNGSRLEIDIQITKEGYKLSFLHPDDNFILSEMNSTFMFADLLIKKLCAFGINIVLEENSERFVDISEKVKTLEDRVYDCMALLCAYCNFKSSKKHATSKDAIVLNYVTKKEEQPRKVVIRHNEVIDYEVELKRIEKAKEAMERERLALESLEIDDLENKNETTNETNEMNNIAENETEINEEEAIPEEIEQEAEFCDLYHFVLNEMDEKEKEDVLSTNTSLIENVRVLLKRCRPISSM